MRILTEVLRFRAGVFTAPVPVRYLVPHLTELPLERL